MALLSSAATHRTCNFSYKSPVCDEAQELGAMLVRHQAADVGSCSFNSEVSEKGAISRRNNSLDVWSRRQKMPSSHAWVTRHRKPFLRDGRIFLPLDGSPSELEDCLELLERMEEEGTLDMDKVSHDKFFNACKRRQAVKEAFRFTKLIPKPNLSTFNQLAVVCARAKDAEGAFEVLSAIEKQGLQADCILYTTLISAFAKSEKIEFTFQLFHDMLRKGVEPNLHTYGALIDGCARTGQVGKAFGAYGIMRSKKLKPDRVIFNSLITACGRAGALERAFDVLAEMNAEPIPVQPNYVTIGALIGACTNAGQVDKAMEVYKMMKEKGIDGSIEVYTEAVHACSVNGDLDTALLVYEDLKISTIEPDQIFFSALIDVAGHATKLDICTEILKDMKNRRLKPGVIAYSAMMGACSNTGNWEKALEVYMEMLEAGVTPNICTMNALLTALGDACLLNEAKKILQDMNLHGIAPSNVTYAILFGACEKAGDIQFVYELYQEAMSKGISLTAKMCENIIGLCLQFILRVSPGPTPTVRAVSYTPLCKKCMLWAQTVYRKAVSSGVVPTMRMFSQLLGCLRMPKAADDVPIHSYAFSHNSPYKQPITEDAFGVYDPRVFSLYEEAVGFGLVPAFTFTTGSLLSVDTADLPVFVAEVYVLKILKALKHKHAAGAMLPSIKITLGVSHRELVDSELGRKEVILMSGTSQAICGLLRSLGISTQGDPSKGKVKVSALTVRSWLERMCSKSFMTLQLKSGPQQALLRRKITEQQRILRYSEAPMLPSFSSANAKQMDGSDNRNNIHFRPLPDMNANGGVYAHSPEDRSQMNGAHSHSLKANGACNHVQNPLTDSSNEGALHPLNPDSVLRTQGHYEEVENVGCCSYRD